MFPSNSKNRKSEATSRKTLRTKSAPDGAFPVDSPSKPMFGKKPASGKSMPKR